MGAGVKPRIAAAEPLDMKLAAFEIPLVEIGDLQLAPRRRLHPRGHVGHPLVVEVKPDHREVRWWMARLLDDAGGAAVGVHGHHAVALGVAHLVGEHGRAVMAVHRGAQQ